MICKIHGDTDDGYYTRGKTKICKKCEKKRTSRKLILDHRKVDLTGMKVNYLTFIKKTERRYRGAVLWKLKCVCNKEIERIAYFVCSSITTNCGCKTKELNSKAGKKTRKFDPRISSARSIWRRTYKDGCDFDSFFKLSQNPCAYCGKPPSTIFRLDKNNKLGEFIYNGLDRVDNSKDHSLDNVVTCCAICNMMKNSMPVDVFLNHISCIMEHQNKAGSSHQDGVNLLT